MPLLYPTVPLHLDETLTSYVSRLAYVNRAPSASAFCKDLGYSFLKICYGREEGFAWLSKLTDEPVAALRHAAVVLTDDRWLIRGERFLWPALRRSSIAFCPVCVRSSAADPRHRGAYAYERIAWSLDAYKTCHHHATPLTIVESIPDVPTYRDFANLYQTSGARSVGTGHQLPWREATTLERYIAQRLDGAASGGDLLDEMPMLAAMNACEALGTAEVFGVSRAFHMLNAEEKFAAGMAGFEALRRGRVGIIEVLDRIRASHQTEDNAILRASSVYGRFYKWIYASKDPAFNKMKGIVVDYILNDPSFSVAGYLFGQRVENRSWQFITAAPSSYRLTSKRLRKVLLAAGKISDESQNLHDNRIVLPTDDIKEVVEEIRGCVGWFGLVERLGVCRQTARYYVGNGLVEPYVNGSPSVIKSTLFRVSDIDAFLARLTESAVPVESVGENMLDIAEIVHTTKCVTSDVLNLILGNRLQWLGLRSDRTGVYRLLLNQVEVTSLLYPGSAAVLSQRDAVARLRTSHKNLRRYIDAKILSVTPFVYKSGFRSSLYVTVTSIERFENMYITRYDLACALNLYHRQFHNLIRQNSIVPAYEDKALGIILYHRKDVELLRKFIGEGVSTQGRQRNTGRPASKKSTRS